MQTNVRTWINIYNRVFKTLWICPCLTSLLASLCNYL
jgi:hypothetical protein